MKMKHLRYLLPAILLFSGYGYATAQSMTDIDAILSEARSRDQENRRIQLDLIRRTGAGEMSASLADSLIMVSRQIEKTDRKTATDIKIHTIFFISDYLLLVILHYN